MPIGIPASGGINPAPGVTAASPATAPVATPSTEGRRLIHPRTIQVKAAAAAEALVATKALDANPAEVSARVVSLPSRQDVDTPVQEQLVVEYYSR